MRIRFWKRPTLVPEESPEELWRIHPAQAAASAHLRDIRQFRLGDTAVLQGWLSYETPEARARLAAELAGEDVSWFAERVDGATRITVTEPRAPAVPPEWRWNLLLFALTVVSTLWAGAYLEGAPWDFPLRDPGRLLDGAPFSASLLGILAAHEFGHYVAARRYGLNVTLPFFIPLPVLSPIGTLGAVIRMKTPIYTRRMLLDVGAAGPLAGIVVAIPVAVWGVLHSPVLPVGDAVGIRLGEPLLFQAVVALAGVTPPEGQDVYLGSVAFAGWIGFLVTALNLLPLGQLDGGHILYALAGRLQHAVGWAVLAALLILGWWWPGWYVWALLIIVLIRVRHPPVLDPEIGLDARRVAVGWLSMALFAACFTPVPFDLM